MLQPPNGIGRCGGNDKIAGMSTQVGPTRAETLVNSLGLIRIDIDPEQSVADWRPDVHIVADARAALAELLERVPAANARRENRETEFAQMKAQKEEALGRILAPQRAYTKVIRDALPEDGIVCFDVTQLHFYSWWGYPAYRPRTVIQPGYQGTLG